MNNFMFILFCYCFTFSCGYSSLNEYNSISTVENDYQFISPTECYTVIEELGEGVFGKVFAVMNSKGEKFALKSYKGMDPKLLFADPEREFQRGQVLDHPNIIKSFELFSYTFPSDEITQNLVLELVEGKTLHNSRNRELQKEQSLNANLDLISALRYALSLGFVHVDLHGGNLMLNQNMEIRLIDLASFFSFEELYQFFISKESESLDSIEITASQTTLTSVNSRLQRIQQFAAQNVCLNAKFKEIQALRALHQEGISVSSYEIDSMQKKWTHNLIHAYYFDEITNIVIKIITKSNLDRYRRIDLRTKIKQLAWNYEEDIEEGQYPFLDAYIDSLVEILKS